jgi:hypothetical protein
MPPKVPPEMVVVVASLMMIDAVPSNLTGGDLSAKEPGTPSRFLDGGGFRKSGAGVVLTDEIEQELKQLFG